LYLPKRFRIRDQLLLGVDGLAENPRVLLDVGSDPVTLVDLTFVGCQQGREHVRTQRVVHHVALHVRAQGLAAATHLGQGALHVLHGAQAGQSHAHDQRCRRQCKRPELGADHPLDAHMQTPLAELTQTLRTVPNNPL